MPDSFLYFFSEDGEAGKLSKFKSTLRGTMPFFSFLKGVITICYIYLWILPAYSLAQIMNGLLVYQNYFLSPCLIPKMSFFSLYLYSIRLILWHRSGFLNKDLRKKLNFLVQALT